MNGTHSIPQEKQGRSRYFVPQQILLLIEHDGLSDDFHGEQIVDAINVELGRELITKPFRSLAFPARSNGKPFTLLFADVPNVQGSHALVDLLIRLEDLYEQQLPNGVLRAATPNWLGRRAPVPTGGGSPGAMPLSASLDPRWRTNDIDDPNTPFSFTLAALATASRSEMQPVEVAILDTAPCRHDLVSAYLTWQAEHPLIRSLLQPDGQLHVTYAPYDDLLRLTSYQPGDPLYQMADHGLFVAGIIHSIAPHATLRLMEVLNHQGVGDLESIATALHKLVHRDGDLPLVINCSFVLSLPSLADVKQFPKNDPLRAWLNKRRIKAMGRPLEWVFDVLHDQGMRVVAAAGNDSSDGKDRFAARFPAAYDNVLGVAATLEGKRILAGYSNLADTTKTAGIATFGGAAKGGIAVPEEGVLGVYIGNFPDGTRNISGWAWWAGTSFAAPIISGALAALLAQGSTHKQALRMLRAAEKGATPQGVETLTVTQGMIRSAQPQTDQHETVPEAADGAAIQVNGPSVDDIAQMSKVVAHTDAAPRPTPQA